MATKAQLATRVGAGVCALLLACVPAFEGTVFKTYLDPVGIPTACVGHTGSDVQLGQEFTPAECDDILATDLMKHDADIGKCVPLEKLTDGQHAAFLSFAFNVGAAKFCASTMARLIRESKPLEACAQLTRWIYAGGRVLPGLVKRREAERAMCEGKRA